MYNVRQFTIFMVNGGHATAVSRACTLYAVAHIDLYTSNPFFSIPLAHSINIP